MVKSVTDNMNHNLNDTWILWAHIPDDTDWTLIASICVRPQKRANTAIEIFICLFFLCILIKI